MQQGILLDIQIRLISKWFSFVSAVVVANVVFIAISVVTVGFISWYRRAIIVVVVSLSSLSSSCYGCCCDVIVVVCIIAIFMSLHGHVKVVVSICDSIEVVVQQFHLRSIKATS